MINFNQLQTKIEEEIEWRIKELTAIKTLPLRRHLNQKQKSVSLKYAIPSIYSIWEGFVKTIFRLYINEINALSLSRIDIHENILVHGIDMTFPQINTGISNDFAKKRTFLNNFLIYIDNHFILDTKLPTESNITYKVINQILERFNLTPLPNNPHETRLNRLLQIRNSVAHGDGSITIDQSKIDDAVECVTELMDELLTILINGCRQQTYKKINSSTSI